MATQIPLTMFWGLVAFHMLGNVKCLECFECFDILDEDQSAYLQPLETNSQCSGSRPTGNTATLKIQSCQPGEMCTSVRGLADIKRAPTSGTSQGWPTDVPVVARMCWPSSHRPQCDDIWSSYHDVAINILTTLTGREVLQFREGEVCYCDTDRCPLRCAGPAFAQFGSHCMAWWMILLICVALAALVAAVAFFGYRHYNVKPMHKKKGKIRNHGNRDADEQIEFVSSH